MNLEYVIVEEQVIQNGNQVLLLTYEVDIFKPKCWVEGFHYHFNRTLISKEIINAGNKSIKSGRN